MGRFYKMHSLTILLSDENKQKQNEPQRALLSEPKGHKALKNLFVVPRRDGVLDLAI